jgi:hypothetical protein
MLRGTKIHKRLIINPIVKRFGVKKGKNTEGVQKSQTLDYQTDSQAFCVKKGENTEGV